MNCFNGEKYLAQAIDSVYAQTYPNWEIIFWDNGSTDNSPEIAKSYDQRLRYFRSKRTSNLYEARNMALMQAEGEFIAFLDCDDLWMPEKIKKQIPLFEDTEVGLVFCDAIYFNDKGKTKRLYATRPYYTGWCFPDLLSDYFICLQTVVIRHKALDTQAEWFDHRFNIAGDTDLFRRIAYDWKLAMVNEPLAKYRIHSTSLASTQSHLIVDEISFMIEKYNVIFPEFEKRFPKESQALERDLSIHKAIDSLKSGKRFKAMHCLYPHALTNVKIFSLFILTFFPTRFFVHVLKLRNLIQPLKY
jgi:glycosyltransferase involved in cell wall biosynthesis